MRVLVQVLALILRRLTKAHEAPNRPHSWRTADHHQVLVGWPPSHCQIRGCHLQSLRRRCLRYSWPLDLVLGNLLCFSAALDSLFLPSPDAACCTSLRFSTSWRTFRPSTAGPRCPSFAALLLANGYGSPTHLPMPHAQLERRRPLHAPAALRARPNLDTGTLVWLVRQLVDSAFAD